MASAEEPVVLWCLRGHGRDVRCLRQKTRVGLELRVLWGDELFLTEHFREPDRLLERAEEFRATLETRGCKRVAPEDVPPPPGPGWMPDASRQEPDSATATRQPGGLQDESDRPPMVLIVDDEGTVRSFLKAYIEEAGYQVCEAGDVDSALTALDDAAVDAVVLDVRMPDPMGWGRTGLEVLAFIRLHTGFADLPVLILTGHPLEPEEHDLVRRHRAYLFQKPDGYRMLLQRLRQLTGR